MISRAYVEEISVIESGQKVTIIADIIVKKLLLLLVFK
jgi:hypothetical protein